jgi:hypothetical protein
MLCNPFLGNGSVNTFPRQQLRTQRVNGVLSSLSAPRSEKELGQPVQLSSAREADRKWRYSSLRVGFCKRWRYSWVGSWQEALRLNSLKSFPLHQLVRLLPYKLISALGYSYELNMLDRYCVLSWMLIDKKSILFRHILTSAASRLEFVTTRNHVENLWFWDMMLTRYMLWLLCSKR